MTATHDLFLSYRRADLVAVTPLLAALAARGVRVWHDASAVEDLAGIQQAVATGLANARALLVWYSGRYNGSRACQWELTSAYAAAQIDGDPRRRILVVNPEPGAAHVHLPELADQLHLSGAGLPDDAVAVQALADRIEVALARVPSTPLGALRSLTPPLWLPAMGTGSSRFVGRLREMWQLHGALLAGQAAMLTGTGGKPGLALVRGAGGIGKSLMAEEYALRFGAAYPAGVFWLRAFGHPDGGRELDASQRSALRDAQITDFAAGLGIDAVDLTPSQLRGALAKHFAQAGQPFLWVVDDLPSDPGPEGLAGWQAPHPLGCTLFTTRTRRHAHVPTIELPQLEADDARRLLTRQRPLTAADAAAADAVCCLLGHHALAIDVTAAWVDRRGLEGVLKALQRPDRDALALAAQFDEALPNGHQRHIAATFLASIQQLDEPARELLRCAAELAVAPIPPRLLANCLMAASQVTTPDEAGGPDVDDVHDEADLAISRLLSTSLADEAAGGAVSVHTLVSRTVRFAETSAEARRSRRARIVGVMNAELPRVADIRQHDDLTPWVTHARELSATLDTLETAALLGWVSRFDHERGHPVQALKGYERQAFEFEQFLGRAHVDTRTAMKNLAVMRMSSGDLQGARELLEVVLAEERNQEPGLVEDPSTMNMLVSTLLALGEPAAAAQLINKLHDRLEPLARLGLEFPDYFVMLGNIAKARASQGDLPGAIQLNETLLAWSKGFYGDDHVQTWNAMGALAANLADSGDGQRAKALEEGVLASRVRHLGRDHPWTLSAMGSLAARLRTLGELSAATELLRTEVETSRRVFGEVHPSTLIAMNNLAITLWDQGEKASALEVQTSAVAGYEQTLGATHADTLAARETLQGMANAQARSECRSLMSAFLKM